MKYIIEITELETRPEDWTKPGMWPHVGFFMVKGDTSMYHVYSYGVNYISYHDDFTRRPVTDEELSPTITQDLLLKAIAAAAHAKVLK